MNAILRMRDIRISYGSHVVVDNITFDVMEGDMLGIVGPNGAGKSTLFRAILGLQSYSGNISILGYDKNRYNPLIPLIGYVPQKIQFESNFPATVYDVVSMGIISSKTTSKGMKMFDGSDYKWNRAFGEHMGKGDRIANALKTTYLEKLRDRRIGELSGGERQRVFIAKALVKDPLMMILDEPVTSVDVESQNRFYSVVERINKENRITMIWSSHDLDAINSYANKVACMNRRLFFHGDKKEFFENEEIIKTYTESAMQAHLHAHEG